MIHKKSFRPARQSLSGGGIIVRKITISGLFAVAFLVTFFVFSTNTAKANTGYLDDSTQNTAKVCKDVSCTNPPPGIIDFKIGKSSLTVDSISGIKGKIFGNELGNITLERSHRFQRGLANGGDPFQRCQNWPPRRHRFLQQWHNLRLN